VFRFGGGADTITDFRDGDRIAVGQDGDHRLKVTASGNDTVVSWGNGDTITLRGVAATDLTVNDFRFVGSGRVDFDHDGDGNVDWEDFRSADGRLTRRYDNDGDRNADRIALSSTQMAGWSKGGTTVTMMAIRRIRCPAGKAGTGCYVMRFPT